MDLFTVDEARCELCELCALACPAGLVDASRGTPVPAPADGDGEYFVCGHCVAAAARVPRLAARPRGPGEHGSGPPAIPVYPYSATESAPRGMALVPNVFRAVSY